MYQTQASQKVWKRRGVKSWHGSPTLVSGGKKGKRKERKKKKEKVKKACSLYLSRFLKCEVLSENKAGSHWGHNKKRENRDGVGVHKQVEREKEKLTFILVSSLRV